MEYKALIDWVVLPMLSTLLILLLTFYYLRYRCRREGAELILDIKNTPGDDDVEKTSTVCKPVRCKVLKESSAKVGRFIVRFDYYTAFAVCMVGLICGMKWSAALMLFSLYMLALTGLSYSFNQNQRREKIKKMIKEAEAEPAREKYPDKPEVEVDYLKYHQALWIVFKKYYYLTSPIAAGFILYLIFEAWR
jgi:hypothetical protein